MQRRYDDSDLEKAEYLINHGYVKDLDMFELAEKMYNQRIGKAPTHEDNIGLFDKVFND